MTLEPVVQIVKPESCESVFVLHDEDVVSSVREQFGEELPIVIYAAPYLFDHLVYLIAARHRILLKAFSLSLKVDTVLAAGHAGIDGATFPVRTVLRGE